MVKSSLVLFLAGPSTQGWFHFWVYVKHVLFYQGFRVYIWKYLNKTKKFQLKIVDSISWRKWWEQSIQHWEQLRIGVHINMAAIVFSVTVSLKCWCHQNERSPNRAVLGSLHENYQWNWHKIYITFLADRPMSDPGYGLPVDPLDTACKTYRECIWCVNKQFEGGLCQPEIVAYGAPIFSGNSITCTVSINTEFHRELVWE